MVLFTQEQWPVQDNSLLLSFIFNCTRTFIMLYIIFFPLSCTCLLVHQRHVLLIHKSLMPNTTGAYMAFDTCVVHKWRDRYLHECMKSPRSQTVYGERSMLWGAVKARLKFLHLVYQDIEQHWGFEIMKRLDETNA